MAYETIEAAAVAVLILHPDYDTNNCKAGDSSTLRGGFSRVARFSFGGTRQEQITIKMTRQIHVINIDVFVPYRGTTQGMESALTTERQKVIDQIGLYPRLNACLGVVSAQIVSGDRPEPLSKRSSYRGQRIRLEVVEIVKPARTE